MSRTLLVVATLVVLAGCGGSSKSGFPTVGAAKTYQLAGFQPAAPAKVGRPTRVSFVIRQPDGQPLTRFRRGAGPHTGVHLIIVRRDLATIIHRHPPIAPDGTISDTITFTKPGPYRVVVLLLLVAVPVARADGDPASDYLIGQSSFIPPDAGVPPAYAKQLNQVLLDAKESRYPIRVALIASRYDLGSVGVLYRQPKRYARFLGQELLFVGRGRLLVVMPNGLGFSRGGKAVPTDQAAVDRLPPPGASGAALASTATHAVVRLAANAGVVVPVPPLSGDAATANPNHDRLLIALITAAALVGLVAYRLWRRFKH